MITPGTKAPEVSQEKVPEKSALSFRDRTPCNWHIVEIENGIVEAVNTNSHEKFEGNLSDFNKALRG
jgi:hypothetical protein